MEEEDTKIDVTSDESIDMDEREAQESKEDLNIKHNVINIKEVSFSPDKYYISRKD